MKCNRWSATDNCRDSGVPAGVAPAEKQYVQLGEDTAIHDDICRNA
jgi:hypothetical protein